MSDRTTKSDSTSRYCNRLREALDYFDDMDRGPDPCEDNCNPVIVDAARRFLALTETGQRVEWCEVHKVVPHSWHRGRVEEGGEPCRIITAYVIPADYLTEEDR